MKKLTMVKNSNGFTLIEIMVGAAIFAIVTVAISTVFLSSIRGQRFVFAQQDLVDNTRFALEMMARQIRMVQHDSVAPLDDCTGALGQIFSAGGTSISFVNFSGDCVSFRLDSSKIQIRPTAGDPFLDVTSNDIRITNLDFIVAGEDNGDGLQPRVTIVIEAEAVGTQAPLTPQIRLQTTISARNMDVP
jgi:prepilin-type N-terminal cleavage/methylation domain-containing protein